MEWGRRIAVHYNTKTSVLIFDLNDFSLNYMDYDYVKFLAETFETCFPETLQAVWILNAPWIFQGCWKIIQFLLDPDVAKKIIFLPSYNELSAYMAKENILEQHGGTHPLLYPFVAPEPTPTTRFDVPFGRKEGEDSETLEKLSKLYSQTTKEFQENTRELLHLKILIVKLGSEITSIQPSPTTETTVTTTTTTTTTPTEGITDETTSTENRSSPSVDENNVDELKQEFARKLAKRLKLKSKLKEYYRAPDSGFDFFKGYRESPVNRGREGGSG